MGRMVGVGGITTLGWAPGNGDDDRDGENSQAVVVLLEWEGWME